MANVHIAEDKSFDEESITPQSPTILSIIDHELNRHGMGRYHWLIWGVCSTGFMLDLLWTLTFPLVSPIIQREFGFPDKQLANLNAAYGAGMVAGAFVWGILVDIVGRRVAFIGTALVAGIFGMCSGAMSSFSGLQAIVVLIGFGTGGNIPVDSTITVEYLPQNRFYLLTLLAIFGQVGALMSAILAYGFIPKYSCSPTLVSCHLTRGIQPCCSREANMGWRYLFFTMASITLAIFIVRFFIFPFYESPKFLASKGNSRGAVEVVQKVAAFNRRSCNLTVESLQEQCKITPVVEDTDFSKRFAGEMSRLKLLFGSWRMTRVTILVWIAWGFSFGFAAIGTAFLPIILQRKNTTVHISLEQTYIDYIIINAPGLVSVMISTLMVRSPIIGRKWTLLFASTMMSLSLFLYTAMNTQSSRIGLNTLFVIFQCAFNSVLWGWTPEAFPTAVRGTGAGMGMVLAILLGTCAPLFGAQVFSHSNGSNAVLYLAGGGILVSPLALLCIPTKDMVVSRNV